MKKIKVCLVYPGISWSGFGSFHKNSGGENNFIHHGIASLASVLVKNKIEVEYVDLRKLSGWREFNKIIKNSTAQYFGISSTTVDFDIAIKVAKNIKKLHNKSKIIIGGVHPTVRPQDAIKIKEFDFVISGEGEQAILDIVNKKTRKRFVIGTPYDLSAIPHIDRDLFDHKNGEMISPFVADLPAPFATFISSRGCPFNCTFCQPAERMVFGGKVRLRSIDDFVKEIIEVEKKYGLKSFLIHDDLFLLQAERIMEFCEKYKKSGVKAIFMCQARADLIIKYKKEMRELKKVGLRGVMIGFESGSQRVLDFLCKQVKVEQNIEAGKICKKLGIKIWANFMLGIPSETYFEMIKTLIMIRKINPEYYSPSLFTPYPETKLFNYCKERNLLIFKHYSEYRRSINGNKIKGFNYTLIRTMLFLFLPFKNQVESFKALIKNRFIKFNKKK